MENKLLIQVLNFSCSSCSRTPACKSDELERKDRLLLVRAGSKEDELMRLSHAAKLNQGGERETWTPCLVLTGAYSICFLPPHHTDGAILSIHAAGGSILSTNVLKPSRSGGVQQNVCGFQLESVPDVQQISLNVGMLFWGKKSLRPCLF